MGQSVTVRVVGGLGNQLHCYAFGRAVARRLGARLFIDRHSGYWNDPYGRSYLLDAFPGLAAVPRRTPTTPLGRRAFSARVRLLGMMGHLLPIRLRLVVDEPTPRAYQPAIHLASYRWNPYFTGYWASDRYYLDVEQDLRRELAPPPPVTGEAQAMMAAIRERESCAIHWRSYAEESGPARASMASYYTRAIQFVRNARPSTRFFAFSDDIRAARRVLSPVAPGIDFVDIPAARRPEGCLIDFSLMHACNHVVIGDSTFSWWAAWLGASPSRVVVAPSGLSPWGDDWIPAGWHAIPAA